MRLIQRLFKTGIRYGKGSESINRSSVYFVPSMVLGTGYTRTSPCLLVASVRVAHLLGDTLNAAEVISGV